MTEDIKKDVQPEQPSTVEAVSQEVQKPPEPSAEEKLAELVKAQVAAEVTKMTEASKREIQSVKDKARREVEEATRRAKTVENVRINTLARLKESDPDTASALELEELRARERVRMEQEQEEAFRRQQEEFSNQFKTNLEGMADSLGIDKTDPSIDWAEDAPNYLERMRRFNTSVAKIQKDAKGRVEKEMADRITAQVKKDLGIDDREANSVDTRKSGGIQTAAGIPTDLAKFRTWVAGLSVDEYEKLAPDIDKALSEGKIK